jgi:uncharacterized protein
MPTITTINVSDIVHRLGTRKPVKVSLPIEGLAVSASAVPDGHDVDLDLVLEAVAEGVLARGTVAAPWQSECRRCLAPVSGRIVMSVSELFEEHPVDVDTYALHHEQVDLEPLAREAVLLELPQAPLCRSDCAGLCPTCGADLNEGPCGCPPPDTDPRWDKLHLLRFDAD